MNSFRAVAVKAIELRPYVYF